LFGYIEDCVEYLEVRQAYVTALHQQGICAGALAYAKRQRPDSRPASPGKVAGQSKVEIASAAAAPIV
jgi:hypothetical protein